MVIIKNRTEQHTIKRSSSIWKLIDSLSLMSNGLYNHANYIIRQEFINNKRYKDYYEMARELKSHHLVKSFGSQVSQQTLRVLDAAWKSFFESHRDWEKHPDKYIGRPRLPKYRNKSGRFVVTLSNIQFKIIDGYVRFSWTPLKSLNGVFKTNITGKLGQIRFVPQGSSYVMEIVYQLATPESSEITDRVIGIDIGVDNLATISNNIGVTPIIINGRAIKSMNQYYNKNLAAMKSDLEKKHGMKWSKRLQAFTDKHRNKTNDFLHNASRKVIDWCILHRIDTIVIGKNVGWKQNSNLRTRVNQNFVQIPHARFIEQLQYKAENVGIKVILTEESYTSGTSFLDGELPVKANYKRSRRIHRGLFESNDGVLINADLNGAYQIVRKVIPDAFADRIEDVGLHPVRLNI